MLAEGFLPLQAETPRADSSSITGTSVSPFYTGAAEKEMTYDTASVYRARTETDVTFSSIADAAAYIREQMVNRAETVTFHFDTASDDFKGMAAAMMDEAVRHTGQSTEGDYLAFQYGGWQMSCSYSGSGADRDVVYTFHLDYYTTKEQETAVTDSLARVYKELELSMLESEYSRFKKIYDYVIAHVTYDTTHVGNASYKLPHTAYAALINKTCVCQGYTVLMYRMLLDWGIDTRIISGNADNASHAWNIVRIGDLYYNADAT